MRLGHAAHSIFAASHLAFVGSDKGDAVGAKRREIAFCRRMLPHAHIHGRRGEHLLVGGKENGGGKIVGQAMRHLGEKIGGRRRHDDEIGLARETDVADLGLVLEIEEVGKNPLLGEHGERERGDERSAAVCEDRAHRGAPFLQAAHEIEALIGGDAAADDQEDAFSLHVRLLRCHARARRASSKPSLAATPSRGLLDCPVKPGNDNEIGLAVNAQKSNASAIPLSPRGRGWRAASSGEPGEGVSMTALRA